MQTGRSPLHPVARLNKREVAELLLDCGADVSATDNMVCILQ